MPYPIAFNVEGELTLRKRVKCSHALGCNRTHEVSAPRPETVHNVTETVCVNGVNYELDFSCYIDQGNWYIQKTIPICLGRSRMLRTYYVAYDYDHIPDDVRARIENAERSREAQDGVLPSIDEAGESLPTSITDIDIDFTQAIDSAATDSPIVPQPSGSPVTDPFYEALGMPSEGVRSCSNCMFTDGRNGGCPRRNCPGYSLDESSWTWDIDYNGRQARADYLIEQGRREREESERREIEAAEALEREASMRYVTGIWIHHMKGGRL